MSKDFVVGRIVKMSDVPFHKGSAGYDFIAAQRRKEAEAILAAEHRVAEAALNIDFSVSLRNGEYIIPFCEEVAEFVEEISDLRRLKGEG